MSETLASWFHSRLPDLPPEHPDYVCRLVDAILSAARAAGAGDVHLIPGEKDVAMSWRIGGVLQPVASFPREIGPNVVARLKVLADLLTYRADVPQEGRIRSGGAEIETRVSTFPTLFGEKAVVRLFVGSGRYRFLDELGLPPETAATLARLLNETGGLILATGPAGSGKTTTLYACLRHLAACRPPRMIATLEDPVEAVVEGAAQSQVRPAGDFDRQWRFDYETGLKSLMRQDPDVIMVGEIRDRITADIVFQASLTGHLVLTSFHAGSAADALGRLLDMGIEPYQLRSGVLAILNQRLLRRLCECAVESESLHARARRGSPDPAEAPSTGLHQDLGRPAVSKRAGSGDPHTARTALGLDVERFREPVGCERCHGTGYRDRLVLAEMLLPAADETGRAIVARSDTRRIERLAIKAGMITRWERARLAVEAGLTSPAEVRRVLGFGPTSMVSGEW